jgi:hypothetical protein
MNNVQWCELHSPTKTIRVSVDFLVSLMKIHFIMSEQQARAEIARAALDRPYLKVDGRKFFWINEPS